ncbi:MAG: hypothetical protein E6Q25_02735 [Acinetobacter sp.]|jgi:hypothetical protein|nr:MAG: hypothetical protein E6Q25_02735 [Acinetobacter sp.]
MQKKDDFKQSILHALNEKADNMPRHIVIQTVFERLEEKRHAKYNRWGIGLALAAAITGLSIVPTTLITDNTPQDKIASTPKLTPQLADDLEMLLVLGEDATHGS